MFRPTEGRCLQRAAFRPWQHGVPGRGGGEARGERAPATGRCASLLWAPLRRHLRHGVSHSPRDALGEPGCGRLQRGQGQEASVPGRSAASSGSALLYRSPEA